MARIRSIKPIFFRHAELQDLELAHPGTYPMLVFAGLWGHCDKRGVFIYDPRTLKLDVLPFLQFDMAGTIDLLIGAKLVYRFRAGRREYGYIPSFTEHQSISGKESLKPPEHPDPPRELIIVIDMDRETGGKEPGSDGAIPIVAGREGKGREKEGREDARASTSPPVPDAPPPPAPPKGALAVSDPVSKAHACMAMRELGIKGINPSHPDLQRAIDRGATVVVFADAASKAAQNAKGTFAYVLGVVHGWLDDVERGRGRRKASNGARVGQPPSPIPRDLPPEELDRRRAKGLEAMSVILGKPTPAKRSTG
jgi:hypothetical protein